MFRHRRRRQRPTLPPSVARRPRRPPRRARDWSAAICRAAASLSIVLALVGDAPPRPITRSGARVGDLLFVTGRLGEAALGVRELRRNRSARGPAVRRFREPPLRVDAGALLARSRVVSAMIDVSDGLLQDLRHLCAASRVGACLELERIPASARVRRAGMSLALSGGEDYELLCAVPARHRRRVERFAAAFRLPVHLHRRVRTGTRRCAGDRRRGAAPCGDVTAATTTSRSGRRG